MESIIDSNEFKRFRKNIPKIIFNCLKDVLSTINTLDCSIYEYTITFKSNNDIIDIFTSSVFNDKEKGYNKLIISKIREKVDSDLSKYSKFKHIKFSNKMLNEIFEETINYIDLMSEKNNIYIVFANYTISEGVFFEKQIVFYF